MTISNTHIKSAKLHLLTLSSEFINNNFKYLENR